MKKYFIFFLLALSSTQISAQVSSIRIMSWNLLNWPITSSAVSDSSTRCPHFRTVLNEVRPDILVTQENAATYSTTWFLNCALNASGNVYSQGSYIHGYDTNNGIFYKDSLFEFISNTRIPTELRDINEFKLVFRETGDTLRIYSVHLKASSGSQNEAARGAEVDSLRKVTNQLPYGTDFIVCGDFNIYETFESAFIKLLQVNAFDEGYFIDPINLQDTSWNKSIYRQHHTQSTHDQQSGGFVGGGLDDRFDMILISEAVSAPTGVYYVAGSTTPYGNDGNHFNKSVNDGFNYAVSGAVADALYGASDHLPVFAQFDIGPTSGLNENESELQDLVLYPNPTNTSAYVEFTSTGNAEIELNITDISGQVVYSWNGKNQFRGRLKKEIKEVKNLKSGIYFISISTNKSLINRKLIIVD
ncbi:MAG TPA: T9SS type A sorting domain-containing protein [Bacteroidia bacterium]|nr:T9SS type A sorting domain-containing protein [Bacteroidia bacterium]HNS13497.1 T9SS type A sorting domain-containing protein [Bacteroidia bacterium]